MGRTLQPPKWCLLLFLWVTAAHGNWFTDGIANVVGTVSGHGGSDGSGLLKAATDGDTAKIKELLKSGANPDTKDEIGLTPLLRATMHNHLEAVQALINAGADVDVAGPAGITPLITAAIDDRPELGEALINAGADINLREHNGHTALEVALAKKSAGMEKVLIKAGAGSPQDPNSPTSKPSVPPLLLKAFVGDTEDVKALIKAGADVDMRSKEGRTPLIAAASRGHSETVQALIKAGANVDLQDNSGESALMNAIPGGFTDIVKALIAGGADVNKPMKQGVTPLILSALTKQQEITEALIDAGAKVNQQDEKGHTPLIVASCRDDAPAVEALLRAGADPNLLNSQGKTAYQLALEKGNMEAFKVLKNSGERLVLRDGESLGSLLGSSLRAQADAGNLEKVKALLEVGADVDSVGNDGMTAVLLAGTKGHVDVVQALVDAGANLDIPNKSGNTPLMAAALAGQNEAAEVMIKAGADLNRKNALGGSSAIYDAVLDKDLDLVKALIDAGANVNIPDMSGKRPLSIACSFGETDVVEALVKAGAEVAAKDHEQGLDALHEAALAGKADVIKVLIKAGADVSSLDKVGRTPLHLAAAGGSIPSAQALIDAGAKVNLRDKLGSTPWRLGMQGLHYDMTKALEQNGATFTDQDVADCKLIGFTSANDGDSQAEAQLNDGANVNVRNMDGKTPLWIAVDTKREALIKALLNAGADPNIPAFTSGQTPLHVLANRTDSVQTAKELLGRGADPNVFDREGLSPVGVAARIANEEVMEALLEHGGSVNARNPSGDALLHMAIQPRGSAYDATGEHADYELLETLLNHHANVNVQNARGRTPGFLAVLDKDVKALKMLNAVSTEWAEIEDYSYALPRDATADEDILTLLPPPPTWWQRWSDLVVEPQFHYSYGIALGASIPLTGLVYFLSTRHTAGDRGYTALSKKKPSPGAQELAAQALHGDSMAAYLFRWFEVAVGTILPVWTISYWISFPITAVLMSALFVVPSAIMVGLRQSLHQPALLIVAAPFSTARDLPSRYLRGIPFALLRCALVVALPQLLSGFGSAVLGSEYFNMKYSGPQLHMQQFTIEPGSIMYCMVAPMADVDNFRQINAHPHPHVHMSRHCEAARAEVMEYVPCLLTFLAGVSAVVGYIYQSSLEAPISVQLVADNVIPLPRRILKLAGKLDSAANQADAAGVDEEAWKKVAQVLPEDSRYLVGPTSKFWTTPYFDFGMLLLDFAFDVNTMLTVFVHHHWWCGGTLLATLVASTVSEALVGHTPMALFREAQKSSRLGFRTVQFKLMQQHEAGWEAMPFLAVGAYAFWFTADNWFDFVKLLAGVLLSMRGVALFLYNKLDLQVSDDFAEEAEAEVLLPRSGEDLESRDGARTMLVTDNSANPSTPPPPQPQQSNFLLNFFSCSRDRQRS